MSKNIKQIKTKNNRGFTLVETLVAVGLFSVIMTMGVSALMTILGANAKAQNIKTAVNNVNFAVETISSALMTSIPGSIYCLNSGSDTRIDCEEGVGYEGIEFEKQTKTPPNILYKIFFDGDNLMIKKGNILESVLIPASIKINNKEIFHVSIPSYSETKRIEIVLDGTTGSSARGTETTFNLQTGVTKLGQ
ncbi:MAG: type II secretion system protein [Minisyncoccia bacterium]